MLYTGIYLNMQLQHLTLVWETLEDQVSEACELEVGEACNLL